MNFLDFPDPHSPLTLSCDFPKQAIGGMLKQHVDDKLKIIYDHSQKCTPSQQKYYLYEGEALAIVECVRRMRHFLLPLEFTTETDHYPLVDFHKKKVQKMH
ncbi:unnamed protein product [Didymodactylos carnosus]|uniref:Reverse transcriptase RNase H-like domain-containing protein n=1 Tax=Didymodactylos carnosus TaxID=1234261 RepID=A0A814FGD3_9BILA|nr:unnamed protein product [Didymodactylos carnosus]CAF3756977.1 unnamed protein product [Didymodactylos carnosus]